MSESSHNPDLPCASKAIAPMAPAALLGKPLAIPGVLATLGIVTSILLAMTVLPRQPLAQSYPEYDFQVQLDTERNLIKGIARIRVAEDDPRPRDAWWFRLPPNRFAGEDPRGIARGIAPLPMGIIFTTQDPIDPMFPGGFDPGNIEIVSVEDEAGRRLSYSKEADPHLRIGMWREDALMRVHFAPDSSGREVRVHFVTRLPKRHTDGWSETGIIAEQWHPLLLAYRGGAWVRDAHAPAGARYHMRLEMETAGWIKTGPEPPRQSGRTRVFTTEPATESSPEAQRVFPLIYLHGREQMKSQSTEGRFQIFYEEGNQRVARRTLEVARHFTAYLQRRFGLSAPHASITFIQSGLGTGEIFTVGNAILIPTVYFKNNNLLDRVYTGKLARAISELYFGEGVWSNRNTDAWLHLGLTGFLALDYFEFTYGWDAPVHDLVDWLSPRYREHFFEAKALEQIRGEKDVPLTVPIYFYEFDERSMVAVYQKAPLVIRALEFAIGIDAFREGLRNFYGTYRGRQATVQSFQTEMEEAAGQSLDWYFDAWFHGTSRMDYALGDWESVPTKDGHRLSVEVLRLEAGTMPLQLQINLEDGRQIRRVWNGRAEKETLVFDLPGPVESLDLDPREYLLETSRINNHSSRDIRWRPFYDWSKERESLVTIVTRLGGNAIDGNIFGLGTSIKLDSRNSFTFIPIYGENTDEALFEADYSRSHFIGSNTTLQLLASKLGGRRTFSTGVRFTHVSGGNLQSQSTYALNLEEVEAASLGTSADEPIQQPGSTNNISLLHESKFKVGEPFASDLSIEIEHSQPAFGSEFKYTSLLGNYGQQLEFHVNHALRFELIRGLIDGNGPVQKQHLLGDPLVLRGFPRTISLVSDNIAAFRLEYQWVATRRVFGESVQNRKLTLLFFGDVGKGWNNGENFDDAITRRDVGIGFVMDLSLLNTLDFPIRVELAYPVGDPEFKDRQVILFQAVSFF